MINRLSLFVLFFLGLWGTIALSGVSQEVATPAVESSTKAPDDKAESTKTDKGNAGQSDLDTAMDLKMEADDIDKCTKVIELIEGAIKKGLPVDDEKLAKQLLASAALDRAKIQLQEMIRARVNETMARRVQRKVLGDLDMAIKNDPTLGEAYLLIAKLSIRTDPDRARSALDKAIEQLAHDHEKRGEAFAVRSLFQEKDDEKIADLKQAMSDIPQSVEVQRSLFALLLDKERFQEVFDIGMELLKSNGKNPIAIPATITALLELDRKDEALKLLDDRIESDAGDATIRTIRANVYLAIDRFEDAIADATKIIEQKPDNIEGFFIRGKAYLQQAASQKENGNSEVLTKARRDIESALDLKPNSAEGIRLRAVIASQQKRYDEAIQDMTLLAKNNPQEPMWLLQLATLYQLDDRPSMATKVADQLILMDKKNWRAFRIRGDAKLSIGDQQGATLDYKKALEHMDGEDEERSGLLNNLAWILATSTEDSLRDGNQSVELGKEACELTKYEKPHILSTLAAGYAEIGDFDEAVKWSSKAVELGGVEAHDQLDQLEKELKSYHEKKPWREKQEVKENKPPIIKPEDTIET